MKKTALIIIMILIVFFGSSCKNKIEEPQFRSSPTIEGRVMLPEEADSLDSVYIFVSENGNQYQVASDGKFSISGLKEDVPYTLYFSTEPFSSSSRAYNNGKGHAYGAKKDKVYATIIIGDNIGVVNVKKTGTISGRVILEGESDFTGIDVFIPGTSYMAKTDTNGNYVLSGIPEGVHRIAFMRDGFITTYKTDVSLVIDESSDENNVALDDVTLQPATASIIGHLIFEGIQSAPYPAVTVTAINEDDVTISGGTTTSDENGQFAINNLKDGKYTLQLIPSSAVFQSKKVTSIEVKSPSDTLVNDIVINASGGQIIGKIESESGEIENATVLFESSSYRYSTVSGSDGNFSISNIIPDTYDVTIMASGYASTKATIAVSSGQISTLNTIILVPAYGIITGKVFLEGKEQHSGITVTATSTNLEKQVSYNAITGNDGSYSIKVDNAAQYTVVATANGYMQSSTALVDVSLGYSSELATISLKKNLATYSGIIQLDGAASFEGITVLLTDGNHNSYTSTTDQGGKFIINDVSPGTYYIQASKDGYVSEKTANFYVAPGNVEMNETIILKVGVRSVTGNVTLELKNDYSGVTITATSLSDPSLIYSALSNSDGNYSLVGMKPGEYLISLSAIGYGTVTLETVNVVTDSVKNLGTVNLAIDRGVITGIVKLEGYSDYSGTLVELVGTTYTATTDSDGIWTMSVPSANYSGGVRFSHVDFETASESETITVLTEGAYSVPEKELSAIAITVKGHVDVAGTDDDSGARVYFDDIANVEIITDSAGIFSFPHIPLGEHTLIIERENTPTATVKFMAMPSPALDLGTIRIIPNSSNIEGYVYLDSLDYFEGITVSVETKGETGILTTTTDSTGYYYIGNLISTGEHSVTFSKKGWDSQYMTVSGLTPLETKKLDDVTLVDTTVPVINSVRINNGASTAADKDVTIYVDASDEGSGIAEMQVIYDESLDGMVDWEDYSSSFERELESGNGLKSVYIRVKDTAGNISNMVKAEVRLTDQKKEVSGVLSDEDLIWTKEMSPYLVVGNIMVERGKTLTIEPGTVIQFAGPFIIQVEGTIIANGTENEHIVFYGIEDGEGTWRGINGVNDNISYVGSPYNPQYSSGNLLRYVEIQNCTQGVQGNLFVESSSITGPNDGEYYYSEPQTGAVLNFTGILKNSDVSGDCLFSGDAIVSGNRIISNCFEYHVDNYVLYSPDMFYAVGNNIKGINDDLGSFASLKVGYSSNYYYTFSNNIISRFEMLTLQSGYGLRMNSNTFTDCGHVYLTIDYPIELNGNDFKDANVAFLDNSSSSVPAVQGHFNSLRNVSSEYERKMLEEIDFSYNYWGKTNTIELNGKGENANISFIEDYYDDFDKTRIKYDNWLQNGSEVIGAQGNEYIAYEVEWDEKPFLNIDENYSLHVINDVNLEISSLDAKGITEFRYSIDPNDIFNESWTPVNSGKVSISLSLEEAEEILEKKNLILQVRDKDGNEAGLCVVDFDFFITGPADGYIIYDEGQLRDDGWRFIEQSPYLLARQGDGTFTFVDRPSDSFSFGYFRLSPYSQNLYVNESNRYGQADCTRLDIGDGKRNTELLVNNRRGNVYYLEEGNLIHEYYAPDAVYEASFNGYDDWYLPSIEEAMLLKLEDSSNVLTSTEYDTTSSYYVYSSYYGSSNGYVKVQNSFNSYSSSLDVYGIRYF